MMCPCCTTLQKHIKSEIKLKKKKSLTWRKKICQIAITQESHRNARERRKLTRTQDDKNDICLRGSIQNSPSCVPPRGRHPRFLRCHLAYAGFTPLAKMIRYLPKNSQNADHNRFKHTNIYDSSFFRAYT
jgi:hypothetical protein